MLDEMKRLADELEFYLGNLPEAFIARRAAYLRVALLFTEGSLPHLLSHVDQIETALKSAN
jgi:hypothetical protein